MKRNEKYKRVEKNTNEQWQKSIYTFSSLNSYVFVCVCVFFFFSLYYEVLRNFGEIKNISLLLTFEHLNHKKNDNNVHANKLAQRIYAR